MAAIAEMPTFHERPVERVVKEFFDGILHLDREAVPLHDWLETLRQRLDFVLHEPARQLGNIQMLGACQAMMPALPYLPTSTLEGGQHLFSGDVLSFGLIGAFAHVIERTVPRVATDRCRERDIRDSRDSPFAVQVISKGYGNLLPSRAQVHGRAMFVSKEDVLREAERHERIADDYRANLARLDDPRYAQPFTEQGEAIDYGSDRKTFARDAESAAAWAARLRRFAEVW